MMTTKRFLTLTLQLTATASLSFALANAADEKHDHKGKSQSHSKSNVNVTIPETAEALWAEIDAKLKTLVEAVSAKKNDGIHELAETVETLVSAIPTKEPDLSPEKKKRAEGMAKNIGRVLDELHEEAEEGHWEDAAKKLKQADAALKIIKTQAGR